MRTAPPADLTRALTRRQVLGLVAAGTVAAVPACTGQRPPSPGQVPGADVTLQFWTWTLKEADPKARNIIERYESANPGIKIKMSEVGGTADTSAKLITADRADDVPDVVQVEYRALASLVTAGVVTDITTALAQQRNGVDANVWDLTTLASKVYGVPQDIGPMMLIYRADVFAQYGITVPTTWAQYADAAAKIHAADRTVYIAAFAPEQFEFFAAHAAQVGGKWWSTDGTRWTVGIDDPATQQIADFWQDLVDRDLVTVQPLLTPEYNAQLNAGKILSWAAAAWAPSVLYSVAPTTAGKWAAAPLPQWSAGLAQVPFLGGSAYLVPQKCKNAAAATKFAAWLGASDEGSQLLLGLDIYPAGNAGRRSTLTQAPPRLMPQQTDFYSLANQVIKDTRIQVQWGPGVNVAQANLADALSSAAQNKTSFQQAFAATQSAVVADLRQAGYAVTE